MRKIYLLIYLFPIISFAQELEGQKLIDSLLVKLNATKIDTIKIDLYSKISFEYSFLDLDKNLAFVKKEFELATKIKNDNLISNALVDFANYYIDMQDYNKSKMFLEKAKKYNHSKSTKAKLYKSYGSFYYDLGDYKNSLQYYLKSLSLYESLGDKSNTIRALGNVGNIYGQINEWEKAIKMFKKCLALNKQTKSKKILSKINYNIGINYSRLGNYDQASYYLQQALETVDPKDLRSKEQCLTGLGHLNLDIGKYNEAENYYEKSIDLAKETNNNLELCLTYSNLGEINYKRYEIEKDKSYKIKQLQKSTLYFQKSTELSKLLSHDLANYKAYSKLSRNLKLQNNFKESLVAHEEYLLLKDSIFNLENKETIKNLEDKREIELRDKEIKINKLALESKEKQKWFYILGIGFLTILGGLLFYQSQKRKQNNLKLEILNKDLDQANKTKTRFFSILNHDLRGPVANLIHFLHLQKDSPELLDEATKNRMQDKTITGAENLLSSMEDILLWSKGQMENFKPQPKKVSINQLFDDTKKVFSGYLKITFEYQNPNNVEVFTDENYLKTIIRNLTSNAINVFTSTENPTIIWKAWQENNNSYLSITDNGPGASQENFKALYDDTEVVGIKTGLGLHLIRDLAKAIDCEIEVDSSVGVGTTFTLKL